MGNIPLSGIDCIEIINDPTYQYAKGANDKAIVIFVGPSGCGKSTTLRMIAGLEKVSEGELYMNVFDNIAYSMRLKHLPKKEIRQMVEEVAKLLGIEALLKRKPKELSGGQKQRVAMGRAIVRKPNAFLFDGKKFIIPWIFDKHPLTNHLLSTTLISLRIV